MKEKTARTWAPRLQRSLTQWFRSLCHDLAVTPQLLRCILKCKAWLSGDCCHHDLTVSPDDNLQLRWHLPPSCTLWHERMPKPRQTPQRIMRNKRKIKTNNEKHRKKQGNCELNGGLRENKLFGPNFKTIWTFSFFGGLLPFAGQKHPKIGGPTRDYDENSSLRVILIFWGSLCPWNSSGKKDLFREVLRKLVQTGAPVPEKCLKYGWRAHEKFVQAVRVNLCCMGGFYFSGYFLLAIIFSLLHPLLSVSPADEACGDVGRRGTNHEWAYGMAWGMMKVRLFVKRVEEQNLARMAPWKPVLEILSKLFLRAKCTEMKGVRNSLLWGFSSWGLPTPHTPFVAPFGVLWDSGLWVSVGTRSFCRVPGALLQIVASFSWAHSEGHPPTEGAFTGTLVNVVELLRNSGESQGGSWEYGPVGSPKFAKVRMKVGCCFAHLRNLSVFVLHDLPKTD